VSLGSNQPLDMLLPADLVITGSPSEGVAQLSISRDGTINRGDRPKNSHATCSRETPLKHFNLQRPTDKAPQLTTTHGTSSSPLPQRTYKD
jgi:hypothetical protein